MPSTRRSLSSRRLIALFLAVLVPPTVALLWLGARVLEQDRRLLAENDRQQRETAADSAANSLAESLNQLRRSFEAGRPVEGSVQLRWNRSRRFAVAPASGLAWTPTPEPLLEGDSARFADAELSEFTGRGDRGRALYASLAGADDPRIRAGALVRLARVHRTTGRIGEALDAYARLGNLTNIAFDGTPADLLARRATCGLLERTRRQGDLANCAAAIERDLAAGRWSLDYSNWHVAVSQLERWTGRPVPVAADRRAASAAADWLWRQMHPSSAPSMSPSGHRLLETGHGVSTIEWSIEADVFVATVITPGLIQRWIEAERATAGRSGLTVSLLSIDGKPLAGAGAERAAGNHSTVREASATGLPWTIVVSHPAARTTTSAEAERRWTLNAGLAVIVLFLAGGGVLIWRVLQRELAMARLQTEFVSAVSHEFRTPLTSLRHVSDLLDENDNLPPERRASLYQVIGRSTARLGSLVESLLDFARMEGGRRPYDLLPRDAGELLASTVSEFRQQAGVAGLTLDLRIGPGDLSILVDDAALTRAVWNLLENAQKYSDGGCDITVTVARRADAVAIAVKDRGRGIPDHEHRDVFQKFVRGADAVARRLPGTGLGLAIVSHIVHAHGGAIELESAEGAGSTFTIVLAAAGATGASTPVSPGMGDTPVPTGQRGGLA